MALWLPGKSTNPLDRQIDLENPIKDSPLNRGLVFCTGTNFAKSQSVGTVAAFNGKFTSSSPQIKTLGNDSHFFINSAATGWSSSLIFNYPAVTVSCFAYLLTDGSGSQGRLIDVYGGTSYCSLLRWSGGFRCGVSTVGYPNEQSTTTGTYSNNVPYWVTAVFAGGNSYPQIYVNDVNASSASTGSSTLGTFNLNTVTLSSSSYPANGYLNHARVWNRALSANEIKEWYVEFQTGFRKTLNYRPRTKVFYAADPPPPTTIIVKQPKLINPLYESVTSQPWTSTGRSSEDNLRQGLVGAWSPAATGPTGYTLYDLSGKGNNGTLTNMALTSASGWTGANVNGKPVTALSFDGVNDNVSTTCPGLTNSGRGVSVWFNTSRTWASGTYGMICRWGTASTYPADIGKDFSVQFGTDAVLGTNAIGVSQYGDSIGVTGLNDGKWHHGYFNEITGKYYIYIDGVLRASKNMTTNATSGVVSLGTGYGAYYFGGLLNDILLYNRAISPSEIRQLYQLGPGWLARPKQRSSVLSVKVSPISAYTLSASTGSFALTGNATGLTRQLKMTASVGQFTLTGNATGLTRQLKVAVTVGQFTLTGNATTLTHQLKVAATVGAFTLTGNTTTLTRQLKTSVTVGQFTLTGNDAALTRQLKVATSVGQFTLTGNTTGLTRQSSLAVSVGQFTLTGNTVGLYVGKTVQPEVGSFTLTGNNATLSTLGKLQAEVGSFTVTGNNASLSTPKKLLAGTGSLTLTGNATGLARQITFSCTAGNFSLSGQTTNLIVGHKLSCTAGALNLTGNATSFIWTHKLAAVVGQFDLTGNAATLKRSLTLPVTSGTFNLTGIAATFKLTRLIAPSTGLFTLTGINTGLKTTRILATSNGVYSLVVYDVILAKGTAIVISPHQFLGGNTSYVLKSSRGDSYLVKNSVGTAYVVKKQSGESYIG